MDTIQSTQIPAQGAVVSQAAPMPTPPQIPQAAYSGEMPVRRSFLSEIKPMEVVVTIAVLTFLGYGIWYYRKKVLQTDKHTKETEQRLQNIETTLEDITNPNG